jgi:crossover junction endodeoxyribonuclease RuvC
VLPVAAAAPLSPQNALPERARILGLDPGSITTGYAVIDCSGAQSTYVTSGSIRTSGESFPDRLQVIYAAVSNLAKEWQPQEVSIERVFMHRNADSAIKLGQARGAALCGSFAVLPRIFEYAPREIKLAVVGTGAAQKEQVQIMVKHLLKLSGDIAPDAADALAIALCHAHTRHMQGLLARSAHSGGAR